MNNKGEAFLILIADGNIGHHNQIKKASREYKANIVFTSVYNGAQLQDYILRRGVYKIDPNVQPDLIIMDSKLQVIDSPDLLKMIRKHEKMHNIPVYYLYTTLTPEAKTIAIDLGVRGFYQKPENEEGWNKMVKNICDTVLSTKRTN